MTVNISEKERAQTVIASALTFGVNPSLEPIKRICALLGNPQNEYYSIQVAGTNGKSSTSRYLAALIRAAGHSVGLYTSPELISIKERIEVDGSIIGETSFARAILRVHSVAEEHAVHLTEFELITAAALWHFAQERVAYALLEVGLGGRWDATSVVKPKLAIITGVALDHTAILGNSIHKIAQEKASIIKEGGTTVVAPTKEEAHKVFTARALRVGAKLVEVPVAVCKKEGSYQSQNKETAYVAACELLGRDALCKEQARKVLDATSIPGRLEVLCTRPFFMIDAAHNPASAQLLAHTITFKGGILLLGVLADKDVEGIIEVLVPHFSHLVLTQSSSPRAVLAKELARRVKALTGKSFQVFENLREAVEMLLKQDRPVLATGSITVAGQVKACFEDLRREEAAREDIDTKF